MGGETLELRGRLTEAGIEWRNESNGYVEVTTFSVSGVKSTVKYTVISKNYLAPEHDWTTLRVENVTPGQVTTMALSISTCENVSDMRKDGVEMSFGEGNLHERVSELEQLVIDLRDFIDRYAAFDMAEIDEALEKSAALGERMEKLGLMEGYFDD